MGFNKRSIGTERVISVYNEGDADALLRMYTKADALILHSGPAIDIDDIISSGSCRNEIVTNIRNYVEQYLSDIVVRSK